jgi:ubiquinone/menaquinone biosynthesis C-methylase UbiE
VVAVRATVSAPAIPARIRAAVELLDPRPGERILEVGGGASGAAATLIADRLGAAGRLVEIDRSATAIERASARITDPRVTFILAALADYVPDGSFDKVFCLNVNVFWTRPADAELAVLTNCLAPDGQLFLCFDTGPQPAERIVGAVTRALDRAGFVTSVLPRPVLCFRARRGGHTVLP